MSENPTLYWHPMSLPCRAVKALIDIGKVPCKYVFVNLYGGQTRTPQFLQNVNPLGKLPYFTHADLRLSESDAMMLYICETYKSIPESLYGSTPQQRGKVREYLSWYQGYFRPKFFKIVQLMVASFQTQKPIYQNQIDDFQAGLKEAIENLQNLLKGKDYLANNTATIVDLLFFFQISGLIIIGKDLATYKEIDRWFKKIYAIPEVKASVHEWFPMAQQMQEAYKSIKVIKSKL